MKTETMENVRIPAEKWEIIEEYSFAEPQTRESNGLLIETGNNHMLKAVKARIERDEEIRALWNCSNIVAMKRLGYSDHGKQHVEIVADHSLRLLSMLRKAGVEPSSMADYGLTYDDAELIVFLAACLHDVGHSIHRDNHSQYGIWVAAPILNRILDGFYSAEIKTIITSEVLHSISVHHKDSKPLTIEAGILRVADALDMAQGRTRLWDDANYKHNIHAISAQAIESVEIVDGSVKPVLVRINMSSSAGVFQIDELLRPKLSGSGIQDYVQVEGHVTCEKKIVTCFNL